MKVAKIYSLEDIRIEDMPTPEVGPGEALIRMKVCGLCTSDMIPWYVARKVPAVLGHEPVGVVVKVGRDAVGFQKGDPVFVHHHAPCFTCRLCRRGFFSLCKVWKASHLVPGGLAEFVKIPAHNLKYDTLKLPEGMSFEDGSLIEPLACSVKALKRARVRSGDIVLVIGLGIMGQLNALLARHYGARMVFGADLVPYRLEKVLSLGADAAVDVSKEDLAERVRGLTDGLMADVVIVGPGSLEAMRSGLSCAGRGGTVMFFTPSGPEERLEINPHDLYFNEVTLMTSYSCGPYDTREAMELIGQGIVSAERLVTHRFPLEETAEGFKKAKEAGASLKTLIVMDGEG
ncbi:MAG: sorbitol dehydrogenase [Candidatus Latescibacteria bacterium]|nr:sorbitol dehydrogenase [Candidatus Latescibacterota bacterium]